MVRQYRYIDFQDRKEISTRYLNGDRVADIADGLGVTTATVYRELKRGETGGLDRNQRKAYNPVLAQQRVQENFKRRGNPRSIRKGGYAVNNFEEITKNPETLGAFLRGLPVIEAPWDEEFQRKYCAGCGKVSCDDGSPCPYEDKRNNPLWWLSQESEGTQRA